MTGNFSSLTKGTKSTYQPLPCWIQFRNRKKYIRIFSSLRWSRYLKSFLVEDKELFILRSQCHGFFWPGDMAPNRRQAITKPMLTQYIAHMCRQASMCYGNIAFDDAWATDVTKPSMHTILASWNITTWWCHHMEALSTQLALCVGNPPVTGGFPSQRPVMWTFDVSLVKLLDKEMRGRWFESSWRSCDVVIISFIVCGYFL